MKKLIKKILKTIIPYKVKLRYRIYRKILKLHSEMSIVNIIRNLRVVFPDKNLDYMDDYVRQFSIIMNRVHVDVDSYYIYPYDAMVFRVFQRTAICSITVDFETVLRSNLYELCSRIGVGKNELFKYREQSVISSIKKLVERLSQQLSKSNTPRAKKLCSFFSEMFYRSPNSLDEALQKILFYDALFWQMGHHHIGLGRLDFILWDYYKHDIDRGFLTEADAKELLREFILALGKDTIAKSPELKGDTGQYILLGGINEIGHNIDNPLTEMFIDIMAELKIPDPKLILRVNENTTDVIWEKAVLCIMTGIGSPLIMDEVPIMEKMSRFGYSTSDVWNIGTSACWEPLIIGKSFDQNNPFRSAVAIKPLNKVVLSERDFGTFEEFYDAYKEEYKKELKSVIKDIDFDCSPLFSLFFDDCLERECDFTCGGAVYSYHGAQVVSFPNTINALLNIKRLVFDEGQFTLSDCRRAIETNFDGLEDFRILLSSTGKKFGANDKEVLCLTNDLILYTSEIVDSIKCNGKKLKIGFSSPNYIEESRKYPATLDGRRNGDPFAVHISPMSSKIDISEILDFSSRLEYKDNCINGNVVDFILPSSYRKLPVKLIGILKNACTNGLYELQLNILDKATLEDAKAHPEKYPNLVVRVWGFSAYFNDLPEEYKDNLIRRAEIYEIA